MKAKDLEQGKYYSTVEFGSNGAVLRQRWWYITLREDKNIRAMVVEKLWDNPLSFYSDFEVWYSDFIFEGIIPQKKGKDIRYSTFYIKYEEYFLL